MEWISWLAPHNRLTTGLIAYVEQLVRILPIRHVAELVGLAWHTAKEIVMDEFAQHKGHRYATIIADAQTMQVLWIVVGRTRESIRPFF